jgi:hypothetical protein
VGSNPTAAIVCFDSRRNGIWKGIDPEKLKL